MSWARMHPFDLIAIYQELRPGAWDHAMVLMRYWDRDRVITAIRVLEENRGPVPQP